MKGINERKALNHRKELTLPLPEDLALQFNLGAGAPVLNDANLGKPEQKKKLRTTNCHFRVLEKIALCDQPIKIIVFRFFKWSIELQQFSYYWCSC